jgi:hypothetical protein
MDDETPELGAIVIFAALSHHCGSWLIQARSITCAHIRPMRRIAHDGREVP